MEQNYVTITLCIRIMDCVDLAKCCIFQVASHAQHIVDEAYTQGKVTSHLWSRYDRHVEGITWHDVLS